MSLTDRATRSVGGRSYARPVHPPQPPPPPYGRGASATTGWPVPVGGGPVAGAPRTWQHGTPPTTTLPRVPPRSAGAPGIPAGLYGQPPPPGRGHPSHGHRRAAGTVGAILATTFSTTVVVAFASRDLLGPADGSISGWWILGWLVALVVDVVAVALRTRHPVAMCVTASVTALLLPLDALAALVVLPWVIARRPPRVAAWCTALVAGATGVSLARDALRPVARAVFTLTVDGDGMTRLLPVGYVVLGTLLLAVAVGAGLVRRSTEVARHAVGRQRHSDRVAEDLRTEISRQDERELIAREVHDTVAHQLSLVSLQAAVLEVTRPDGDAAAQAGRDMRSAAHQALEEMRRLIGTLRDAGSASWSVATAATLADLPELIDTARAAGAHVRAMVFVSDAADAPAGLTRAVYRIVQESLTNALKHAPGQDVEIDVRAAPGSEVRVLVANLLPPADIAAAPVPGAGAGLTGMAERVALAGGRLDAGERDGRFVVQAWLPWPAAGRASVAASTVGA